MTGRIVVGVDGSDASHKALRWASRFAAAHGSTVDVIMAWHYPAAAFTSAGAAIPLPPQSEMEADAATQLAELVSAWDRDGTFASLTSTQIVAEGDAGRVLCDAAGDADALVVGSRGLGGFKGLILGSVGAHCASVAPCPVVIVPGDWNPDAASGGSVIVGVDGSLNAAEAVRWADAWAPADSVLALVGVWDHPLVYQFADLNLDAQVLVEACEATLEGARELVQHHTASTECVRGDARRVLPEKAAGADLLVVGARGHSGLSRALLGSVASSVVHHLVVPTAVVPAASD